MGSLFVSRNVLSESECSLNSSRFLPKMNNIKLWKVTSDRAASFRLIDTHTSHVGSTSFGGRLNDFLSSFRFSRS